MADYVATEAAEKTDKKITEPGDLNNPPGTGADESDFEEDDDEDAEDDDEGESDEDDYEDDDES